MVKRCKFIKTDEKQCEAWAMTDSDFCFTHNPDTKEEKQLAVTKGGKSPKRNYNPLEPIEIESTKDVVELISQTINEVRLGEINIRVANCIGFLSGHLIKALEVANLEERVAKVERLILEKISYKL